MANDPIQSNLNRAQRYWYVDGLAEMAGGVVIFLVGLCYAIAALLPEGPAAGLMLGVGQPVLVLSAAWVSRRVLRDLKERVTYPRTGYVEYRQPTGPNRWARVLLAALVAFGVSALAALLGRGLPRQAWPLMIGLLLALAIAYLGARVGLKRFYAVAGFTLLVGALLCWLNLADPWPAALIFGSEGLAWVVSGLLTLGHYLRSTRPLDLEADDE